MRKLVGLVALLGVAVLALGALDFSDAEARKRRASPPNYNFVLCAYRGFPCTGTQGADQMVGGANNDTMHGAGGNDIYMGLDGDGDSYFDESTTSNDLYGGFRDDGFDEERIDDRGGVDRVDLSSAFESDRPRFHRWDYDSDGKQDDLRIADTFGIGVLDDLYVLNHFAGGGRVEYIKFSDKTLSGANLPITPGQ